MNPGVSKEKQLSGWSIGLSSIFLVENILINIKLPDSLILYPQSPDAQKVEILDIWTALIGGVNKSKQPS